MESIPAATFMQVKLHILFWILSFLFQSLAIHPIGNNSRYLSSLLTYPKRKNLTLMIDGQMKHPTIFTGLLIGNKNKNILTRILFRLRSLCFNKCMVTRRMVRNTIKLVGAVH